MEDTGSVDVGPQARQGHAPERDKRHEVALEADVTESPRQGGAVPEKERGYDSRDPASGQAGNRLVEHVLPLFGEGHVDHLGHRGLRVYLRGRVECEHNRIGDGAMREALEPIDAALLDSSARPASQPRWDSNPRRRKHKPSDRAYPRTPRPGRTSTATPFGR